jgi:hypothetical protein
MKSRLALAVVVVVGCAHPPAGSRAPELEEEAAPSTRAAAEPDEPSVVDEGLVLPASHFEAGERVTRVDAFHIMATVELGGASVRLDRHKDSEVTSEMIEVDAHGEPVRTRVTFAIEEQRDSMDRKTQRTTSPIVGKTYVITNTAGTETVTDDDGRTPSRAEVAAVLERMSSSSGDDALERMLGGRRWFYGERIQLGAAALEAYNRTVRDPGTRYTAVSQQLLEVRDGVAVFRVMTRWDQRSANGVLTFELAGTHEVDLKSGRLLRTDLRGPVRGSLAGGAVNGETTMTTRVK